MQVTTRPAGTMPTYRCRNCCALLDQSQETFRWVYANYVNGGCASCTHRDVPIYPSWFISVARNATGEASPVNTEGNKIMQNLNTAVNLGVSTVSAVGGYRGQIKLNVNLADPETGKQLDTGSQ